MNLLEAPFRALGPAGPRLIMIAALGTSYETQHVLFLLWGVDPLTAAVAPAVIDVLAITCAEILHDPRVIRGKRWAGLVLAIAGLGSMAANWIAGVTIGSKVVHASMVLAYVLAELVVGSVVRRDTGRTTAAAQTVVPEVTADEAASPDLPEAPISPAAPGTRGEYGPRDPERGYAPSTVRAKRAAARATAKPAA